jgi:hypothetical protein
MQKAKEYKEIYVNADEYYIMDCDLDNDLENPFINNNNNNSDNDDQINDFNEFNKIIEVKVENKEKICEKGINTENKIIHDKATNTELATDNNCCDILFIKSYFSNKNNKMLGCLCVVS